MAEEKKEPSPFPAIEALRAKARELAGAVSNRSERPFELPGTPKGEELLDWLSSVGDSQLRDGASDPMERALAHQRMQMRFEQLPAMARFASRGLSGDEGGRDRMRLAASSSTHCEFGDAEELLAAIEARRMVQARGYPRYWSQDQCQEVDAGLLAMMDRCIAENWKSSGEAKASAFKSLGSCIGALGGNCDLMALHCAHELARAGATPENLIEIGKSQAELVGCAKDIASMPSLDRSVGNVALAGLAGVGMAALAPILGHAAMPALQEIANHATIIKGALQAVSEIDFSYGLAISCSALAASAGSFLGVGWRAPSRLDALSDAAAIKQGLSSDDAKIECAKAADDRLRASFEGLSEEMLSPIQLDAFVQSLGFARARLVGTILGANEVSSESLPGILGQSLREMPKSELALIGQISDPAIAACFLLDSPSSASRLDLLMLQKRIDFLGSGERGFEPTDADMEEARKALIMGGGAAARLPTRQPDLRAALSAQLCELTPMGRRFLRLCPKAQQGEFIASLLSKPLDAGNPDIDVASRLNSSLKLACAKIERKSFLDKKISAFVSKRTQSLIENPMRALRSWLGKAFVSKREQVMDFNLMSKALEAASGGLPSQGRDQSGPQITERMQRATARHGSLRASLDAIPASPSNHATEEALGLIAAKLRQAKGAPSQRAPCEPMAARI